MKHARFRGLTLVTLVTAMVLIVGVPSATAVHDLGLFELDENAVAQATPGDDWETIAGGGGSALIDSFITDPVESSADDIFDGGQTKDINNINEWFWKGGEPNDKNDIEHAFAAAYTHAGTGDLIIYFGLDRMDNSGDAAAGFWFLKKPVEQKTIDSDGDGDTENVFVFQGTNTLATHSVGDTLVQTDFTNGGTLERIEAFQWGVAGGQPVQPGSPLRSMFTGADCGSSPPGDLLCGEVNRNSETVPANWPELTAGATTARYFFKGQGGVAPSTTFPTATFFEGGLNATKLLGSDFCAAQMLAETRQSQSETSVLEDKAEAGFNLCAIDVTKTGPAKSKVGDEATYTITVTNTGAVTLFKQSIIDNVIGNLTGNASCGASLAPGASCTITTPYTVQGDDPDPLVNTVSVLYNRTSNLLGAQVTDSASHSTNLFQPGVTITKTGDAYSKTGDTVTYNFTIENRSSNDSPNLILNSLTDNVLGDLSDEAPAACDSLAPGASCNFSATHVVTAGEGAGETLTNTVTVHYHPDGFPNDITDSDVHTVDIVHPSIDVTKTGDAYSKTGDTITYTVTIKNTGDTPLVLDTFSDTLVPGVDPPVGCDNLAANNGAAGGPDECSFTYTHVVTAGEGAGETLANTATAHYDLPASYALANDITDSDDHTVDIVHPSIDVTKTGDAYSKTGDTITYTVTIKNTGDTPLVLDTFSDTLVPGVDPPVGCDNLAANNGAAGGPDECSFTYTHEVTPTEGAGNSLANTATAHYDLPASYALANDITDSDGHTVTIVHPSIDVTKTGDAYSKTGDTITYTVTIKNTGDTPLVLDTFSDTLVPGVDPPVGCDNLAANNGAAGGPDECSFTYTHVVTAGEGAGETLANTATAHYDLPASYALANDITDSDDHTVDIVHPSIDVTKTGDAYSKTGDTITYTVTIKNTGDTPLVLDTLTDSIDGNLADDAPAGCDTLAANDNAAGGPDECQFTFTHLVTAGEGAGETLTNTATAHYDLPASYALANDITDSDDHTVDIVHPSIDVTKTGDAYSKTGDTITYTVTIKNTGDTPLVLDTFSDTLVPGVDPPVGCDNLAANNGAAGGPDECSFTYTHVVTAGEGAGETLANTATAHYDLPASYALANDITDSDGHTVDIVHPTFTVTKTCTTDPVNQGGTASFTITYNNTGDADLVFTPNEVDEGGTVSVAAGQSASVTVTRSVPDGATSVGNTVTGKATLAAKYGLSNEYTYSASDTCSVKGMVKVVKTASGQPPAAGQTFTFELRQGASPMADGTVLETETTDASGNISFDTQLTPGATYQICEWVFPGWNTNLAGDGPLFVPNSVVPPSLPNPNVNNLTVCVSFTVTSGQTRTFTVDNTPPPGGRALTIGFWKNWASCASSNGKGQDPMLDLALAYASQQTTNPPGGLVVSAQNPGSLWPNYAAIWYRVLKGDATSTEDSIKPAPGCLKAVRLLNKSTIDTGKKMANDPLFNMTAQLVAAQLNRFMGADISGITITNIDKAVLLNGKYAFNGKTHGGMSAADIAKANCLAKQLDNYNNNRPVSNC